MIKQGSNNLMKVFMAIILALLFSLITFFYQNYTIKAPEKSPQTGGNEVTKDESKRIDLYVMAMKRAFNGENGGAKFIAVDFDTLDGLSNSAKLVLLKKLDSWAPEIYELSKIKTDATKFTLDVQGNRVQAIDGTVLFVRVEKYGEDKAILWGKSWFGNLGGYNLKYEATYENGVWNLKEIGMSMS